MTSFLTRYLWRFFILAAALFCWYRALILSADMVKSAAAVSFRYESGGVPHTTVETMLEEEDVPLAAWRQKNGGIVEEREFARNASVHVLEVAGDSELVIPVEELRYGLLPVRGNMDTCAIDEATAYALWGGTDATGEILIYEGREYTIAGIFARPANTAFFQTGTEGYAEFPYLELYAAGSGEARRQAYEFIARYALPEPDIMADNAETAAILRQLALLPALVASALLLRRVLRRIIGSPASFPGRAGFAAAMAAGVVITALAVGISPVLPEAAIPARWSDFSFWSGIAEAIGERARLNRMLAWPVPDLLLWQRQRLQLIYSGAALAGLIIGGISHESKTGRSGKRRNAARDRENTAAVSDF